MPATQTTAQAITFKATLQPSDTGTSVLVSVPKAASDKLPSRGMAMVEGSVNDVRFRVLLQPDGQASHWFKLSKAVSEAAQIAIGDTPSFTIEATKHWPEPSLPKELQAALADDAEAHARWMNITPMARWDWLNWMDSVKLEQTRKERPQKLCSMLKAGKRRPCCFNRAMRTAPKSTELL